VTRINQVQEYALYKQINGKLIKFS